MKLSTIVQEFIFRNEKLQEELRYKMTQAAWCSQHQFEKEAEFIRETVNPQMSIVVEALSDLRKVHTALLKMEKKEKETDLDNHQNN